MDYAALRRIEDEVFLSRVALAPEYMAEEIALGKIKDKSVLVETARDAREANHSLTLALILSVTQTRMDQQWAEAITDDIARNASDANLRLQALSQLDYKKPTYQQLLAQIYEDGYGVHKQIIMGLLRDIPTLLKIALSKNDDAVSAVRNLPDPELHKVIIESKNLSARCMAVFHLSTTRELSMVLSETSDFDAPKVAEIAYFLIELGRLREDTKSRVDCYVAEHKQSFVNQRSKEWQAEVTDVQLELRMTIDGLKVEYTSPKTIYPGKDAETSATGAFVCGQPISRLRPTLIFGPHKCTATVDAVGVIERILKILKVEPTVLEEMQQSPVESIRAAANAVRRS